MQSPEPGMPTKEAGFSSHQYDQYTLRNGPCGVVCGISGAGNEEDGHGSAGWDGRRDMASYLSAGLRRALCAYRHRVCRQWLAMSAFERFELVSIVVILFVLFVR